MIVLVFSDQQRMHEYPHYFLPFFFSYLLNLLFPMSTDIRDDQINRILKYSCLIQKPFVKRTKNIFIMMYVNLLTNYNTKIDVDIHSAITVIIGIEVGCQRFHEES